MQEVFWFLVTIAIVVPIHEYGHYRVAVACDVKVLRFSIGIGRVLWSRRLGRDGTEFAISMLPLGGYVRMLEEREADPADLPRSFNRRPLWQRAAIIVAGPLANLALAVALFSFVQWRGVDQPAPLVSTPLAGSLLAEAGLRSGDRVVAAAPAGGDGEGDWQDIHSFNGIVDALGQAMLDRQPLQLRVTHPGESGVRTLKVALDTIGPDQTGAGVAAKIGLGAPLAPPRIGEIVPGSAASAAGLRAGDVVAAIDGRPIVDAQMLVDIIRADGRDGAPRPLQWDVRRGDRLLSVALVPRIDAKDRDRVPRVGVGFGDYEHVLVREDAPAALRSGAQQTWSTAYGSLRMFGRMLTGRASLKNLSGPGTIAEVASSTAHEGLVPFLAFLAFISVSLGVLNLLPIPMLDGGTLLYYLFEGLTGRPVSELWQVRLQYGGILAILLLMSIALSNDVARHLGQQ